MSETVKTVATSIVEGLRASPVPTILIVFLLAVLGLVYLGTQHAADRYERHLDKLMERCLPGSRQ